MALTQKLTVRREKMLRYIACIKYISKERLKCSTAAEQAFGMASTNDSETFPNVENNPNFQLTWYAQKNSDNSFTYFGKLNDMTPGCVNKPNVLGLVKSVDTGSNIIPGMPLAGMYDNKATDSTRCRGDGLSTNFDRTFKIM